MEDRRQGDRRAPEKGVIKIKKRDAIIYGIIIILVIVLSVICIKYAKTKKDYDLLKNSNNINNSNIATNSNSVENNYINNEIQSNVDNNGFKCNISIEGDRYIVSQGEKIEFIIKASDIQEEGIVMFETLIDYDSNIFDCSVEEDENGSWNKISMIDNYLTMAKKDLIASSEDQVIGKLVFTAKDDVRTGQYSINLTKIRVTTGDNQSFNEDDSKNIIEVIEKN